MEPLNCTAQVQPDRVDVWLGTQKSEAALRLAAKTSGLPPSASSSTIASSGGGFGRRAVNDELVQAVTVAKAAGKAGSS